VKKILKKAISVFLVFLFISQTLPLDVIATELDTETDAIEAVEIDATEVNAEEIAIEEVDEESETELDIADEGEQITEDLEDATDFDIGELKLGNQSNEPEILGEMEDLREESVKHFRRADGSFVTAMYNEPVHYKVAGKWKEIDNTLALSEDVLSGSGKETYVNKASSMPVSIPQDLADGQKITLSRGGFTVGFGVSAENAGVKLESAAAVTGVESLKSNARNLAQTNGIPKSFEELQESAFDSPLPTYGKTNGDQKLTIEREDKTAVKNLTSAVTYTDVFPGADLEYIVTPTKVKENIVVKSPQEAYGYKFDMDFGGLLPVENSDGSIDLVNPDDDEAVFVIQAPYMYDAAGEHCYNVEMTLVPDGENYALTVTADAEWINDESRSWPVVIDPTIEDFVPRNSVTDVEVWSGSSSNFNTSYRLNLGKNGSNYSRIYFKFNLPTLPADSVVTGSYFSIFQIYAGSYSPSNMFLNIYDLEPYGLNSWNPSTITWNNQPVGTSINICSTMNFPIEDYVNFYPYNNHTYEFDLTRMTQKWYNGYINNGFLLAVSNENVNVYPQFYASDDTAINNFPNLTISYVNNTGLEPYWTYEEIDLGRSGTAYINHFNGSLTYIHSDISMSGERMPININHVYTTNKQNSSGTYGAMKVGQGFQLNIMERIVEIPYDDPAYYDNNYIFKYIDEDATVHYFKYDNVLDKFVYEYDETLELVGISNTVIEMRDASGNAKEYTLIYDGKFSFYLTKITDANGNEQTINYTGNRISSVVDSSGRTATFSYANDYLTEITDPAGRTTTFTYDYYSDRLDRIDYPDGKYTTFDYNQSTNNILTIGSFDTSQLQFTYYNYLSAIWQNRIQLATRKSKSPNRETINSLSFSYMPGETVVEDLFNKVNTYSFDNSGRTVNVMDQDGRALATDYHTYKDVNKNNKVKSASDILTFSNNLVVNNGFERTSPSNWMSTRDSSLVNPYPVITTGEHHSGYQSFRTDSVSTTGYSYGYQDFQGVPGKTYTLSAYVKISSALATNGAGGAFIELQYENGGSWYYYTNNRAYITQACDWVRYSYTLTIPSNATGKIRIVLQIQNAVGTVYFDDVQLEEGTAANPYNHLENSQFYNNNLSDNWKTYRLTSDDGVYFGWEDYFILPAVKQQINKSGNLYLQTQRRERRS